MEDLEVRRHLSADLFPLRSYDTGQFQGPVVVADFNNDGQMDIATATNNVLVFLNSGRGLLSPPVTAGADLPPKALRAADMDGDGLLDLVACNPNGVSILHNMGRGNFVFTGGRGAGAAPADLAIADLDGDGRLDVVVANANSSNVSVLLNSASGLQPAVNYPAGASPSSVAVADLNGDGKLDVVVANASSNNVSMLTNNGAGLLAPGPTFAVGGRPVSVIATDLNGDGKVDLATANQISNNASVMYNIGGSFAAALSFGVSSSPQSLRAADLNGDGHTDLVVGCAGAINSVLLNNGAAIASPATNYVAGQSNGNVSIDVGDVDGDGKLDVVTSASDMKSFTVAYGRGDGTLAVDGLTPNVNTANAIATADFNGDGKMDILTTTSYFPGALDVLLSNGNGTFTANTPYGLPNVASAVTTADLNGDGKMDIAVSMSGSRLGILINKGNGTFNPASILTIAGGASGIAAADLNHDGKIDLVTTTPNSQMVDVLLATVGGSFAAPVPYPVGNAPAMVAIADMNNDGNMDLVVPSASNQAVALLLGSAGGTFAVPMSFSVPMHANNVLLTDINGDGKQDIIATSATINDTNTAVLMNVGSGLFASPATYDAGGIVNDMVAADVNQDGSIDLAAVVVRQGIGLGGLADMVGVLLNNGQGVMGDHRFYALSGSASALAADQLDGTGGVDLAVAMTRNSGTSPVAILANSSPSPLAVTGPNLLLRLDPTGKQIQVFANTSGTGQPVNSLDRNSVKSMRFTGTAGNDTFVLDLSNGNPLQGIPTAFDGLGESGGGDTLIIRGTSAAQIVAVESGNVLIDSGVIGLSNVEKINYDGQGGLDTINISAGPPITLMADQYEGIVLTSGANVTIGGDASQAVVATTFSIDGDSKLDLAGHNLILPYTTASLETQVRQYVSNWTAAQGGPMLLSSNFDDPSSPFARTLAVADNAHLQFASFSGQTFAPGDFSQVLVKYTYFGDANLDGQVTPTDYAIVDGNIGPDRDWGQGDLNGDGKVSPADYALIDGNIGAGNGSDGGPRLLVQNTEARGGTLEVIKSAQQVTFAASPKLFPSKGNGVVFSDARIIQDLLRLDDEKVWS